MKKLSTLILGLFFATLLQAQDYVPTPENLRARAAFDSARFGMFIHWGPSSILGSGEWVMNERNIKVDDYTLLAKFFNPIDFDAKAWVSTAKNAGMKYITLITRHHDSFSLWDTKQSDFNIMNTPFKRDVVKEIAEECHKQGIKICFYYSLLDWRREDYQWETGRTGKGTGRKGPSDWNSYVKFMKAQLTELLTNYGPVSAIWFDGHWDQLDNDTDKTQASKVNWHYDEIYSLIHELQPDCLVGNNHHLSPLPGEDFQMFERDLPGENKRGYSGQAVSILPLETCETINGSWGFNITDDKHKSASDLIHYLVRAAGYGANLLLNVGPMPNGQILPEHVELLNQVGKWTKENGATIYGTKGGFLRPQNWGAITQKGDTYYVHVFNMELKDLVIEFPKKIKSMNLFADKKTNVGYVTNGKMTTIDLSKLMPNSVDIIIEVKTK